ncbi:L1 [Martes foina papillomavirus 1]|uniref:Major capsid protein L1 n=1 Tax=Martes foina papillomavirus 1 TaxID=2831903 RepID=A0AAE7RBP2_9PAPI|nr:L1 [Martes foina papillomavirus 1]
MAVWYPNSQKLFLPPTPVAKVLSTDAYVQRTDLFYHANSDRLLTVGHPYFEVKDGDTVKVPKVSGNQFRVFRVTLPDPNAFAFSDGSVYNPERERLVWGCRGVEVDRGQPLGIGLSGNPLFNRYFDAENPGKYNDGTVGTDNRQDVASDVKQTQLLIVGCVPAVGEHWHRTRPCDGVQINGGDCPPLELVNSTIQDGDMIDIGYGAMDFRLLQENRSDVPIDINMTVCKYPDYLKMSKEASGDALFFYARREQMYTRHFFTRAGNLGDPVPDGVLKSAKSEQAQHTPGTSAYFGTPSGSLVTSDAQIFNRPYWLLKAQGLNNGICWNNELFVTVVDNTRGTNLSISIAVDSSQTEYNAANYKTYLRHCEEFELTFIFQLCRVPLTPDTLAHLNTLNPSILENWNLGVQPPPSSVLEDTYRYITSSATRCPDKGNPPAKSDRYEGMQFWSVDLSERMSTDLDQFPLGRKFLAQSSATARPVKRRAPPSTTKAVSKKRKR